MRYDTAQRRVELPDTPIQKSFGIATNSKMFEILYSALYKRPMDAIVRELVSNIFDAHLLNGQTRPGRLILPSPLQPTLVFRDFGPGLSPDGMENLYTQMGASTKEDDEDAIGAFGLGSKTPMAYTDAFTVISRHQGEKRLYTVVKGVDKIPVLQSDGQVYHDDEPDGLEISVPVKPGDDNAWQLVCHRVLQWFPPNSIEVVGLTFPIEPPTFVHETDTWAILPKDSTVRPSRVLMGPVTYELDFDVLPEAPRNRVVFKLPMGAVVPQPSREGLTYERKTLERMQKAVLDFQVEFTSWITEGLADMTPWDQAIAYRKAKTQWEGFPLPFLNTELTATGEFGFVDVREGRRRRRYGSRPMVFDPSRKPAGTLIQPTDASVVILNDIDDPRDVKIKKRLKENQYRFEGKKAIYVVDDLAHVGNPTRYTYLSEYDLPAKDEKIKRERIKREKPMVFTLDSDARLSETLWDEPSFASIYAELNLKTVMSDRTAIYFARKANRAVFGLSKAARRYYRDVEMVSVEDFMKAKLASMRADRELLLIYLRRQAFDAIPSHDHVANHLMTLDPACVPADCRRMIHERKLDMSHPDLDLLTYALQRELMTLPARLPRAYDFKQASARISERYPVFAKLCSLAGFNHSVVDPVILYKSLKVR